MTTLKTIPSAPIGLSRTDKTSIATLLIEVHKYPGEGMEISKEHCNYLYKLVEKDIHSERLKEIIINDAV